MSAHPLPGRRSLEPGNGRPQKINVYMVKQSGEPVPSFLASLTLVHGQVLETPSRLGVRRVRFLAVFPLAPSRRSLRYFGGGLTSPARTSSATAPHLPDADHFARGQARDLPGPALSMPGSTAPLGPARRSRIRAPDVAVRVTNRIGIPGFLSLACSCSRSEFLRARKPATEDELTHYSFGPKAQLSLTLISRGRLR